MANDDDKDLDILTIANGDLDVALSLLALGFVQTDDSSGTSKDD